MTKLEQQIKELSPSVKDALFRRLMFADELAWLRDEKKKGYVTGFEVDLDGQELSGFALIAIQRHTIIAFVSDRNEAPRLILFPALDTLFDPGFGLLDLIVTRKKFRDGTFAGSAEGHGRFGDMVKDLTPPNRKVDISDTVLSQISSTIEEIESKEEPEAPAPVKEATVQQVPTDEPVADDTDEYASDEYVPGYDDGPPEGFEDEPEGFDGYEEPGYDGSYDSGYDEGYYEDEPEPEPELTRSDKLRAQTFNSLSEITDYVVRELRVDRPLAVTLVNKAMQSKVSPEYRIQLAVNIFCKLIDENKI